jgi:predicted transcriptional regulator
MAPRERQGAGNGEWERGLMLQALGLSQEAESVYQAMLDDPRLGIVGLCETLGLDEQSVRDALDELVRFDLAASRGTAPGCCAPSNPR